MASQLFSHLAEYFQHELYFYIYVFGRLFTGLCLVLAYFYISGRTQLSQTNSIDMIGNFIFGGIIGGAIYSDQGSYARYVGILLLALCVMAGVNYLCRKSYWLRGIAIGHPIPIIKDGRFLMENIRKKSNKVDMVNIVSQFNAQGIPSFNDIYFAQIEPSGVVSAISDKDKLPSVIVISRGQIYYDELKNVEQTEKALRADMRRNTIKNIGDVYLAEYKNGHFRYITNKGLVYPEKKNKKAVQHRQAKRAFARHACAAGGKKRGL